MMKHTKGKWIIDIESDGNIWIIPKDKVIAIANICSEYDAKEEKYLPTKEDKANAKLIVAAPELLNIAIKCLDWCNNAKSPDWVNELRKETENVIKKATQ